ncbi:DNA gyrase B [Chitinophaga costaii]|uniref:DNA topoisomerase (ATP-hydrolyzing) n=1 Tax=Chitinophaga costaii TaxID=1335309 RepID=A0A1C4E0I4_9BACT|nr:hypothetical protein [Chitinophaga costaii]PUZ24387.1 hypothetical protein DCM91_13260 [Chitinophaga costaii]SCC37143.1 DNA gyrase B [Chitinophaga costaii]
MENNIPSIELAIQTIRKNPLRYLGSINHNGVVNMVRCLLEDLPEAELSPITVEIVFHPGNRVLITFSYVRLSHLSDLFTPHDGDSEDRPVQAPAILLALNTDVKISVHYQNATGVLYGGRGEYSIGTDPTPLPLHTSTVEFSLDPALFGPLEISYGFFNIFLQQFAYLHPGITIISTDQRTVYQHNVFHYPRGVAEQLDTYIAGYNHPLLRLDLHTEIGRYAYQVSLCFLFTTPPKPKPQLRSFAGSEETPEGGSHLDAVKKGFRMALKEMAGRHKEKKKLNIARKKVAANLSGIVAIQGPALHYAKSSKLELDMPKVKKQLQHYVFMQTVDYLQAHPDITTQVLGIF